MAPNCNTIRDQSWKKFPPRETTTPSLGAGPQKIQATLLLEREGAGQEGPQSEVRPGRALRAVSRLWRLTLPVTVAVEGL